MRLSVSALVGDHRYEVGADQAGHVEAWKAFRNVLVRPPSEADVPEDRLVRCRHRMRVPRPPNEVRTLDARAVRASNVYRLQLP